MNSKAFWLLILSITGYRISLAEYPPIKHSDSLTKSTMKESETTEGAGTTEATKTTTEGTKTTTEGTATTTQEPETGPIWVPARNGEIPIGAVRGGIDHGNEILFVARAIHEGQLIPGKLRPSEKSVIVGLDNKTYLKKDYEVLVSCKPKWVVTQSDHIPPDALKSGVADDGPYYVCRMRIKGTIQNGKMQLAKAFCIVPYGLKEHYSYEYEILCCPK